MDTTYENDDKAERETFLEIGLNFLHLLAIALLLIKK
jgi:hypothetical protein